MVMSLVIVLLLPVQVLNQKLMEKINKYTLLIALALILLVSFLGVKKYGKETDYTLDQSDPMQFVDAWKPALNGTVEYGVALTAVAMRNSRTSRIVWVLHTNEYPDTYLGQAGFFQELRLFDPYLWLIMGDQTSINQVAILNLSNKHLDHYNLPDGASIFVGAINSKFYLVVLTVTQADETEQLVLYNLKSKQMVLLDTASPRGPDEFTGSRWQNVYWVDDTTLEYTTVKGITKKKALP